MNKLLVIFFVLFAFNTNAAEKMIVCPLMHYSKVKSIVEAQGSFDKFKHCSVSCLLTLRCSASDVLEIGVLKEGLDVLGYGNAELADIKANITGISLVVKHKIKTDRVCMERCQTIFPDNACY